MLVIVHVSEIFGETGVSLMELTVCMVRSRRCQPSMPLVNTFRSIFDISWLKTLEVGQLKIPHNGL
jgi:hypothetical protein